VRSRRVAIFTSAATPTTSRSWPSRPSRNNWPTAFPAGQSCDASAAPTMTPLPERIQERAQRVAKIEEE
jgi:hypothetical protein